jgi:SAM-dependent methyltransferase
VHDDHGNRAQAKPQAAIMTRISHYVHGSDEAEQKRLTALNAFINDRMLREMNVRAGERIVDFGAGLGQFTRLLARASGHATGGAGTLPVAVVGVERDRRQIEEAQRQAREADETQLVEFREGDVLDPPLRDHEWGTFDLAHARFILEHVHDPLAVVRTMVRCVRDGGRIVLADDDHDVLRLWPALPSVQCAWIAYQQTYIDAGNDPIIGRRLVELLHAGGAKPVRNTWVFFGACAGEPIWHTVVENLVGILVGARQAIARQPGMSDAAIDQAVTDLRAWSQRPDSAFWYAIALAEGVK